MGWTGRWYHGTTRQERLAKMLEVYNWEDEQKKVEVIDAALVGTWNVTGRLPTRLRESNFMLGAGETPGAGFTGWIDEIRVTPGVLSPSKFMTPFRNGMVVVVR